MTDKEPVLTSEPRPLSEQAGDIIKSLWDRGIIVSHPQEMLHADGLHRFQVAPSISDLKAALVMRQVLPDVLLLLQGCIPKDAKVNT